MLSKDENIQLIRLLAKCQAGDLPSDVFEAIGRIAVYPAVEFIPLRIGTSGVEVLLLQRSDKDPVWPSMWHTPGTVLRPTDKSIDDAIERLLKAELFDFYRPDPHFIGNHFTKHRRGTALGIEYWLEISDTKLGKFFNIDNLPDNFVIEQLDSVKRASRAFLIDKSINDL